MKPFDLAAFISGSPAMTVDGRKATLLGVDPGLKFPLFGRIDGDDMHRRWKITGDYLEDMPGISLIGMWQDPPPKRTFGGLEWEAPLSERRGHMEPYYWLNSTFEVCECKSDMYGSIHQSRLDAGNYFATRQAAQSFADALKTFAKGEQQ